MIDDWQLVEAVRVRPELYDKSHPGFKAPSLKMESWKSVSCHLSRAQAEGSPVLSTACVVARWKCLRERYTREVRKNTIESDDDQQLSSTWPLFSLMAFLQPHVLVRKKRFHFQNTLLEPSSPKKFPYSHSPNWSKPECTTAEATPEQGRHTNEESSSKIESDSLSVQDSVPRTSQNYATPHFEVLATLDSDFSKHNPADADFLIGKSVESALKALSNPRVKVAFRKKFRDLISECEMASFDQ